MPAPVSPSTGPSVADRSIRRPASVSLKIDRLPLPTGASSPNSTSTPSSPAARRIRSGRPNVVRGASNTSRATAAAAAVARDVFEAPRTTFGRPLRMRRAAGELGVLVELGLLAPVGSGRRSIFRLTEAGRRMLRSATLGPVLGDTGAGI